MFPRAQYLLQRILIVRSDCRHECGRRGSVRGECLHVGIFGTKLRRNANEQHRED
jgi:hypothetical protein